LGCTQYNLYQLPFIEANDQWRLLRSFIGPFQQHFKEKISPFDEEENALISRCTDSHMPSTDGQIQQIPLRIASPSSIFAPCDYFLFPNLKKWFGEKRFTTREQLIATKAYFEGLDKTYYSDGFENRSIKCIELKEDYDILRNKKESIKKNVFYYVFLKIY